MQTVTPFLWFDDNAEEAMKFYTSVFKDSKVLSSNHGPDGKFFTGSFEINGQEVMVLNGGPEYKFTEAMSLFVSCDDQDQVDFLWNKLTADGGEESMCGWLKDKFGLSWQIVPKALGELLSDPDSVKSGRTMQAMLKMKKLDVAALQQAHDQE